MPIEAGDVIFRITGSSEELTKALDDAGVSIKSTSAAMLGLGAAITGALGVTLGKWSEAGSEIQDFSTRTGVAAERASELKFALEQSGAGLENMQTGLLIMAKGLDEATLAASGAEMQSSAYADTLARIGLTVTDLAGLSPEEQFMRIGFATAQLADANERAAVGTELMGKQFTQLLPAFMEGEAGIASLTARAHELGIVFSGEEAARAEAFGDTMAELKMAFMGIAIEIGPLVATMAEQLIPVITNTVAAVRRFIEEHPVLAQNMAWVAAGVGALGMTLGTLGLAIGPLIGAFTSVSAILGAIPAVAGAVAFGMGGIEFASLGAVAAMAGPAGLIAVATAAAFTLGAVLIKSVAETKNAFDQLEQSEVGLSATIEKRIAQDEKRGMTIDKTRLAGLDLDAQIAELNKQEIEASIAAGDYNRTIEEQNAVMGTASGLIGQGSSALDGIAASSGSATFGMDAFAQSVYNVAQALSQMNAQGGIGGVPGMGGFGPIPGMATGGMVTGGGVVDVHRDERILLPRGAEVLPRQHTAAGAGMMGGGGPQVTINVTGNSIRSDNDIAELSSRISRDLMRDLRGRGFGLGFAT